MCFPDLVSAMGLVKHFPVGFPRKSWKGCEWVTSTVILQVGLCVGCQKGWGSACSPAPRGRMERLSRAVCWPVAATAPRLNATPFPGQEACGGDGHLHALQHSRKFRTAATFWRRFVLIILFFAFPKFSLVFIQMSNCFLMNCSMNDMHEKPQSSVPRTWTPYGSQCPVLPPSSFPFLGVVKAKHRKAARFWTLVTMSWILLLIELYYVNKT